MHIKTGIFSALGTFIGKNIGGITKGISRLTGGMAKTLARTASLSKQIVSLPLKGIMAGISSVGSGLKKVGGLVASPFKSIGGALSKLNPFGKKSKEDPKQKLRDKVMNAMSKIIDKLWKVVEPFIDKVAIYMAMMFVSVILPISLILAKVLLIVGAIALLGIGLYLVYKWVTKTLVPKLKAAWDWICGFGKWIWGIIVDCVKYVFWGMWVDLGKWIWDKLCQFGNWLYDNYIKPFIIEPFKKYIWEPLKKLWNETVWPTIKPFVDSLTELKNTIFKAFDAWDSNKSVWDNLKNMTSIIKDAVMQWWETSPFKTFYDKYLSPYI